MCLKLKKKKEPDLPWTMALIALLLREGLARASKKTTYLLEITCITNLRKLEDFAS